MKILDKVDILDNIITCTIKAEYNDPLTTEEEQEIETLHDYIRKLKFSDITFSANIDMSSGVPVVATDASADTVAVSLSNMLPKEYVVDENLEIKFSLDVSRIANSELSTKISTKALMGQAKVAVFISCIKSEISDILTQMRSDDNDFEGENETNM